MSKVASDAANTAKNKKRKKMDSIKIRYGESLTMPIDTGNTVATLASIYIGRPGEAYLVSKQAPLTDGVGFFNFDSSETSIPLGTYNYQINVVDASGYVQKYPEPEDGCTDCVFPEFIVCEALDAIEVS